MFRCWLRRGWNLLRLVRDLSLCCRISESHQLLNWMAGLHWSLREMRRTKTSAQLPCPYRPYYNLKRWVGVLRPVIHCFPRANLNILLFKTFLTTSISTLTSTNISTVIRYRWVSFRMQFEYSDLDSDTTRTHHPLIRPTPLHMNLRSMCILCRSNWL